eukprot:scaffold628550_cov38-Prasinocladus_malaysianus.AAC.1
MGTLKGHNRELMNPSTHSHVTEAPFCPLSLPGVLFGLQYISQALIVKTYSLAVTWIRLKERAR